MLEYLLLKNVGPSPVMEMELTHRLNLITGDNGLGKTLLLDVAWYALTLAWPSSWPRGGVVPTERDAEIVWSKRVRNSKLRWNAVFDFTQFRWKNRVQSNGTEDESEKELVVYARVDGGFSVSDPFRMGNELGGDVDNPVESPICFQFDSAQVWDGSTSPTPFLCEGLLRDWRTWATDPNDDSFDHFASVVRALSPGENLEPRKLWRRVFLQDARDIPLLGTPSGDIPIIHAPASMRRILGLAYIIVWAWKEHRLAAGLQKREPVKSMVLLFDEVESHLHPQWQRQITPAIMKLADTLTGGVQFQGILTTHSPLVLASMEPHFDESQDRVFHLHLEKGLPCLHEVPWTKHGDVVNWLVSEVFGLEQGRSLEAETAIKAANAWMRGDVDALPEGLKTQDQIHAELLRVLPGHDRFWPRWVVWVEKHEGGQ